MRLVLAVSFFIRGAASAKCHSCLRTKCTESHRCRRIFKTFCRAYSIYGQVWFLLSVVLVFSSDTRFFKTVPRSVRSRTLLECLVMCYCAQSGRLLTYRRNVLPHILRVSRGRVVSSRTMQEAGCGFSCILGGQRFVLITFRGMRINISVFGIFFQSCVKWWSS